MIEIYNGDCIEVMPTLQDKNIDAVITDPPYKHSHLDGRGFGSRELYSPGGTIESMSDFDFHAYKDILFCAPILVAFCSRDLIKDYANESEWRGYIFDLHVWYKSNAIPFTHGTFKSDLEYIVVAWKGAKKMAKLPQKELSKLFESGTTTNKQHPTEKPVKLMVKYLNIFSGAKIILDPFMGSGTTGVACVRTNRDFIGIERVPEYFNMAEKKIRDEEEQLRLPLGDQ